MYLKDVLFFLDMCFYLKFAFRGGNGVKVEVGISVLEKGITVRKYDYRVGCL